jgi:hypothetical protein
MLDLMLGSPKKARNGKGEGNYTGIDWALLHVFYVLNDNFFELHDKTKP